MPVREKIGFLVEKLGPQYRTRIQQAVLSEEEKRFERALEQWENILTEARKDGKDGGEIQEHLQRLHTLCWQQKGRRAVREAAPQPFVTDGKAREPAKENGEGHATREAALGEMRSRFRLELQSRCLNEGINLSFATQENRLQVRGMLDSLFKERLREIPDWVSRRDLLETILADVVGMGPIEHYLRDPAVSEVMVNGLNIFYEQDGKILASPRRFGSPEEVREIVDRMIQPIGRHIDESSPLVDARLPDGSRVNVVIHPVAVEGPLVTVRKFPRFRFTEEVLIEKGSITGRMAAFFRLIVRNRLNVIVAGKASSGKTTLLNLFGNYIHPDERIVVIEDVSELQLCQPHVVRLEARPPNIQGRGEIPIRALFRNALRMRPDRIVVGECRGAETLDMLQAMNTGHDGSLSTAHANSPWDLFARLEAMVGMSEIPVHPETVRKQIISGIDVVVYCTRFSDGRRLVTSVCEVVKEAPQAGVIELKEMFAFEKRGMDQHGNVLGNFVCREYVPAFVTENAELAGDKEVLSFFQGTDG